MKLTKKVFALSVILIAIFFILKVLLNYTDQVSTSLALISGRNIFFSFILYLGYFYVRALSWHFILKSGEQNLNIYDSLAIWFLGEAARYIPGNVWSFAGRVYLANQKRIPKRFTVFSLVIEMLLMIIITVVLSLPALNFTYNQPIHNLNWLLFLIPLLLAGILLLNYRDRLTKMISSFQTIPARQFDSPAFKLAVLLQTLSWLLFGLGTYVVLSQFNQGINVLVGISIPILAWLVGYLSVVTPMGLGVREGVLIALFTPSLGLAQATMVALISRLMIVLVEVVNLSFWLYRYHQTKINVTGVYYYLKKRWDLVILVLLIIAYSVTFSTLSILRHDAFASSFDLANMGQTVWNSFHGRIFELSGAENTISRFSIHADLILVLLSPIYLIWENVRMLLIAQSVGIALGAVPVYWLARMVLRQLGLSWTKIISLLLTAVYLLNPGLEWTNMYDFHGVSLAMPFLLATFYFAYTKKWGWFAVFAFLSITTKEEISAIIAVLGLIILFIFKERRIGLLTLLTGLFWFITMVFIVIPIFSPGGQHWAENSLYLASKDTFVEALTRPGINHINAFLDAVRGYFLIDQSLDYYVALLKPFAFLPLIGLPWLVLALPELLINILSSNAFMLNLQLHYDSGILPALIISSIFSLRYIFQAVYLIKPFRKFASIVVVAAALGMFLVTLKVNYHYSPLPTTPSCWCLVYQVSQEDKDFEKILKKIPPEASITSSSEIRAHLTRRENSFNLPSGVDSADYVAILDENRVIGDYSPKEFEGALLEDPRFLKTHILLNHLGHFYLFKKIG